MKGTRSLESECSLKYSFGRVAQCLSNHPRSHMEIAQTRNVYALEISFISIDFNECDRHEPQFPKQGQR